MENLNRICYTCGKKYSYCPSCYKDRKKESWHIMFDNKNCKDIFDVLSKLFTNSITRDEALKKIEACDLSDKDNFNENVKKDLNGLLATKKKRARRKREDEDMSSVQEEI